MEVCFGGLKVSLAIAQYVLYCHTTLLQELGLRAISTDIYKSCTPHTQKARMCK